MTIWVTKFGWWTTVCTPCKTGVARRDRKTVMDWAFRHQQRHQKGEAQ